MIIAVLSPAEQHTERATSRLHQMIEKLKNKVSSLEIELEYKRKRDAEEEEKKWKKREEEDDVSIIARVELCSLGT